MIKRQGLYKSGSSDATKSTSLKQNIDLNPSKTVNKIVDKRMTNVCGEGMCGKPRECMRSKLMFSKIRQSYLNG